MPAETQERVRVEPLVLVDTTDLPRDYHPKHQFMLADVDYFVELPDGTIALLEIKTTN